MSDKFDDLASTITPKKMRETALPVLERVAAANARGVVHPDQQGSPSLEHLAFMLCAAAFALEAIHCKQDAGDEADRPLRSP